MIKLTRFTPSLFAATFVMLTGAGSLRAETRVWANPNAAYWEYAWLWSGGTRPTLSDEVLVINPGGADNLLIVAPPSPTPDGYTGTGYSAQLTMNSTTAFRVNLQVLSTLFSLGDITINNRAGAQVNGGTWQTVAGIILSGTASTLTVSNNGSLATNDLATIGSGVGATSTASVTTGGRWFNDSNMTVGLNGGTGLLQIASSGTVELDGSMIVGGGSPASVGTVALFGTGASQGVLSTYSVVKSVGSGTLVFDGGILRAERNEADFVSGFTDGIGIADNGAFIDSNGSTIGISSAFYGQGSLVKLGSGTLSLSGSNSYGGQTVVRAGTLAVNGGVINSPSGTVAVGASPGENASLLIASGGRVQATQLFIGPSATGTGSVTVSGGTLNLAQSISVGQNGMGSLAISGNSVVTTVNSFFGSAAGTGSAAVSGGSWTNTSDLLFGRGSLLITGGMVTTANNSILGAYANTQSLATVSGGVWDTNNLLVVGFASSGTLRVNGGLVYARNGLYAGYDTGGTGSVILSSGTLATAFVLERAGGVGTLNFNGGTLEALASYGDFLSGFEAGDVTIGNGGAFIDSNGQSIGIITTLSGSGGLTKQGAGTLTLSGSNSYLAGTTVTSGTLVAANNRAVGATTGAVVVEGGVFLVESGVSISNEIVLSSGAYARNVSGNLAGSVDVTSDLGEVDTTAQILAGTSGATTLIASFSATSSALNDQVRLSDVFAFQGTGGSIFVLQLSFTATEPDAFLGWLSGNQWVNARDGNIGNNASFAAQYDGSFAEFQVDYGTTLASYIGAWGVEVAGGTTSVWAVLNHNSDFAAVPEPSTCLLLLGAAGLFAMRRQHA